LHKEKLKNPNTLFHIYLDNPRLSKYKKSLSKLSQIWVFLLSQPHFKTSVRMKFTLPKVGTWSPLGLPKTQSLIARIKTPHIEMFFIPLKRSQSVDLEKALHEPFKHLQHKLWLKEGSGIKLTI
jgi:hypothetical protein